MPPLFFGQRGSECVEICVRRVLEGCFNRAGEMGGRARKVCLRVGVNEYVWGVWVVAVAVVKGFGWVIGGLGEIGPLLLAWLVDVVNHSQCCTSGVMSYVTKINSIDIAA